MDGMGDFSKLPPEIRAEIWKLTLITDVPIKITRQKNESPWRRWYDEYLLSSEIDAPGNKQKLVDFPSVNLIRASKAINIEASPILYHNNSFTFDGTNVLETFFDKIGEMAFSLSDVEIKKMWQFGEASELAMLRRMHDPKRIVLRAPVGANLSLSLSATKVARDAWNWVKPIVIRSGTGYMLNKSVRPYKYSEVLEDRTPAWKYEPGSKEEQEKRLAAFRFVVDPYVKFKGEEGLEFIKDAEERAKVFRAIVIRCWEQTLQAEDF